jgi:hypothetical protein
MMSVVYPSGIIYLLVNVLVLMLVLLVFAISLHSANYSSRHDT